MSDGAEIVVLFSSSEAANRLVAGVPAVARALAALAQSPDLSNLDAENVAVAVQGGWVASALARSETMRLAPAVRWHTVDARGVAGSLRVRGASLIAAQLGDNVDLAEQGSPADVPDSAQLRRLSREIIKQTGKPGDGIISRYINRPISQTMSGLVLRIPGVRPWHATLAAGLIGIAMLVALIFYGATGLVVGASLFQLASIVDGVDGEMARATKRSSDAGAMMDSVTDAATNLGFIGGVTYNLYAQGVVDAALAGAFGFCLLAVGSAILGRESRRRGGAFTFDAVKERFRQKPSRLKQWLTYLTMRDFYAFAAFLAILLGFERVLLFIFAVVAAGWFVVVCVTLVKSRRITGVHP